MKAAWVRTLSAPEAPSACRDRRRSYSAVTCSRRRSRRSRRRRSDHSASGQPRRSAASARRRRAASVSAIAGLTLACGVGGVKLAPPLTTRALGLLQLRLADPPSRPALRAGPVGDADLGVGWRGSPRPPSRRPAAHHSRPRRPQTARADRPAAGRPATGRGRRPGAGWYTPSAMPPRWRAVLDQIVPYVPPPPLDRLSAELGEPVV